MGGTGTVIQIHVNPRSSCSRIVGWKDDVLTLRITAPPVEGAANKACIQLLADRLGIKKSQISIVSGASGRNKLVKIDYVAREEVLRRLTP